MKNKTLKKETHTEILDYESTAVDRSVTIAIVGFVPGFEAPNFIGLFYLYRVPELSHVYKV